MIRVKELHIKISSRNSFNSVFLISADESLVIRPIRIFELIFKKKLFEFFSHVLGQLCLLNLQTSLRLK